MVFAVPISWALLMFVKTETPGLENVAMATTTPSPASPFSLDEGPGVTITLEPSAVAYPVSPSVEGPMALPAGYLVPDDGAGDTAHEGY